MDERFASQREYYFAILYGGMLFKNFSNKKKEPIPYFIDSENRQNNYCNNYNGTF